MKQGSITLPPIIVTPEPPLPQPPGPLPGGVIAKPLPWDGKVVTNPEIEAFFNKRNIKTDIHTMSIVMTVATIQLNMEKSYLAYLPQLPADVDAEIAEALGSNPLSVLEKAKAEKAIVDSLIAQNTVELANSTAAASAFFGRNVLAVEMKRSAVDFVNIVQSPRAPETPLQTFKSWEASATAAYAANILTEKLRLLTEKSAALTQAVATAQAEEDVRLAAEAEAKRLEEERAAYELAVTFTSDVNKDILAKYGAHLHDVALGMQEGVSGKKVRSYAEAMETFEKVRVNPNARLSAQDTQAVVAAINALDQATLADNVARLGKAFGVAGKIVQVNTLREKTIVGVETGDWKPLGLELESIGVGMGAGAILAGVIGVFMPVFAVSAGGVVTVALLMALAGAYFDAQRVDQINDTVLNALQN